MASTRSSIGLKGSVQVAKAMAGTVYVLANDVSLIAEAKKAFMVKRIIPLRNCSVRLLNLSIAEKTLAHCSMYAGNELTFLCVERINHFFTAYDFLNGKEILRFG